MTEARPSPEALLRAAGREGRGRLKVFLGAAPGVGKTYAMLEAARAAPPGTVLVGVVETHGRADTAALVDGLEVLPPKNGEMDLDGILARRPAVVLVDELAHTNAEGSRHPKRHQDVQDILAAGIDVWTTLNIQHLESLNDVVARITRVRVREKVPDAVLDAADEIELVDLPPAELIARLRDGKVYAPATAERALKHFFTPGHLTALREMALRRTAARVDMQLRDHMQAHAIEGPWDAGERVLVCLGAGEGQDVLVRHGRRLAERLGAPWTALYVETPRDLRLAPSVRDAVAANLRLAERLGGAAVLHTAADVADEIIAYANTNNFTHIVLGHMPRRWWQRRGSVARSVMDRAGAIAVQVVGARAGDGAPARAAPVFTARPYLGAAAFVAAALAVALALAQGLAVTNIALVFLLAVLAAGATYGLGPGLVAVLLSVATYNFFFLPPLYTFTIADPENVVTLVAFAVAATLASQLAAAVRAQALVARTRARTAEALYGFSRKLAGIGTLDDLLWAACFQVAAMLGVRAVMLLPEDGRDALRLAASYPPDDALDDADRAAAHWAWKNNQPAGREADTLPGAARLFRPMATGRGVVAVLGIDREPPGSVLLDPGQSRLLDALADQTAISIERIRLAEDVDRAKLAAETDRLRAALLTSISHDLRTPLATILGAASSLQDYAPHLDDAARTELLRAIREEAERMNRFIANLLDMTRLESGALAPARGAADLGELVGSALARAAGVLKHHKVRAEIAPDLPLTALDVVLFEQVLFNLLDNAAKYTPDGGMILVRAWHDVEAAMLHVEVIDEGPGIPADALERVFDKFARVQSADRQRPGTGLGLAVCRGFVEAMGGRIAARNRSDRAGAVFAVALPVAIPAAQAA